MNGPNMRTTILIAAALATACTSGVRYHVKPYLPPVEGHLSAPCKVGEDIDGLCWLPAAKVSPPCPGDTLQHGTRCWLPVVSEEE